MHFLHLDRGSDNDVPVQHESRHRHDDADDYHRSPDRQTQRAQQWRPTVRHFGGANVLDR